jgi:hypothetical protein
VIKASTLCPAALLVFSCFGFTFAQSPTASPKPTPQAAGSSTYTRPTASQRRKSYVNSVVGPVALGRYVVSSGFSTARNSPEEWKPTWEGFGRRVASSLGKSAIKNSVQYGMDEAFKVDSKFYYSQDRRAGARLRNSLLSVVTARNESGKRVFGAPRLAGSLTANLIAYNTWYPKRYDSVGAIKSTGFSLASGAAFNLFKEFVLKR